MDTIKNTKPEKFTGFELGEFQDKMLYHSYSALFLNTPTWNDSEMILKMRILTDPA